MDRQENRDHGNDEVITIHSDDEVITIDDEVVVVPNAAVAASIQGDVIPIPIESDDEVYEEDSDDFSYDDEAYDIMDNIIGDVEMDSSIDQTDRGPRLSIERLIAQRIQLLDQQNAERRRLRLAHENTQRRQLLDQQNEEYENAKARDKAKKEDEERNAREEQEAEEARKRKEAAALAYQQKLKESLPSEPSATDKDIITIRLRFPSGDHQIRRFRMDEPVKWLMIYCESIGFNMKSHRLFTSDVPKKDVATLDDNQSFRELKWPPREQITIADK